MKSRSIYLSCLALAVILPSAHAASEAGEDSARYYENRPDEYNGKKIEVDCMFVTRINNGPEIEGIVFFVAHTEDEENPGHGGSIVTAVLADEANDFIKKYGETIDIDRGTADRVDSRRLKGVFHVMGKGQVYLDASSNEQAHELILEYAEEAKLNIKMGNQTGTFNGKPGMRMGKGKP